MFVDQPGDIFHVVVAQSDQDRGVRLGNVVEAGKIALMSAHDEALSLAVERVPGPLQRGAARPLADQPVKLQIVLGQRQHVAVPARFAHEFDERFQLIALG